MPVLVATQWCAPTVHGHVQPVPLNPMHHGRVSLHVLACVHACDTDCALTCEFCLHSLFHVPDVFLSPDYVTNLQTVSHRHELWPLPCLHVLMLLPSFCFSHSHQSMHHTLIFHAFGSPQRQSASQPPHTPSSGASNSTPGGQARGQGRIPSLPR